MSLGLVLYRLPGFWVTLQLICWMPVETWATLLTISQVGIVDTISLTISSDSNEVQLAICAIGRFTVCSDEYRELSKHSLENIAEDRGRSFIAYAINSMTQLSSFAPLIYMCYGLADSDSGVAMPFWWWKDGVAIQKKGLLHGHRGQPFGNRVIALRVVAN